MIGDDGEQLGILTPAEAIAMAEAKGLDLVEVSPTAQPPVCKILDFGKYRYELQKKAKEAKKKQKVIEIKEIKLRPNIDTNDYNVKLRAIHKFLDEGDKVKITLRLRGREMAHMDIAFDLLKKLEADVTQVAKIESSAKAEGRQVVMVLAPQKA